MIKAREVLKTDMWQMCWWWCYIFSKWCQGFRIDNISWDRKRQCDIVRERKGICLVKNSFSPFLSEFDR